MYRPAAACIAFVGLTAGPNTRRPQRLCKERLPTGLLETAASRGRGACPMCSLIGGDLNRNRIKTHRNHIKSLQFQKPLLLSMRVAVDSSARRIRARRITSDLHHTIDSASRQAHPSSYRVEFRHEPWRQLAANAAWRSPEGQSPPTAGIRQAAFRWPLVPRGIVVVQIIDVARRFHCARAVFHK